MNEVVDIVVSIFTFLTETTIFNVGLIYWILGPAFIGLALSLISKRNKKDKE